MKWGVYVDFFDSVGLNVWVYSTDSNQWYVSILQKNRYLKGFGGKTYKNRKDARTAAIEKANEIVNNR